MTPELAKLPDLPSLKQLARALWHNGSIRGAALMVGAGFSKNAIIDSPQMPPPPDWRELMTELGGQLYSEGAASAPKDALRLAEEFRSYFGQAALDGFIRTRFPERGWLPGPAHLQALNLPWSDILTTNWDTLLERSAEEEVEFVYDVVRTEADVPHAKAPRIVKLHGTLGDKDPLIFAAEDYRTYPTRHATFVNLARQIFIENDLCLIGFSGDDPNFLQWAGWVRDQLGGHARRIYLVGYLRLSAPARLYLEKQNFAPIDLAPAVDHVPERERHHAATKLFLSALHAEKPKPRHEWQEHSHIEYRALVDTIYKGQGSPDSINAASEALKKAALLLGEDRERYPGWLLCPRKNRSDPSKTSLSRFFLKPEILRGISPVEQVGIFSEFLWHYTTRLLDLPLEFRDALARFMEDTSTLIERDMRARFAIALMRDARVDGDIAKFEKWSALAENSAVSDSLDSLELQYQRCLLLRDQLDLEGLSKSLKLIATDDPIWNLRLAGLHSVVGDEARAAHLIRHATAKIEKVYRRDRNSVWAKSCLAWARWLARAADVEKFQFADIGTHGYDFREIGVDPEYELTRLSHVADERRRRDQEDTETILPLFEAGHFRPARRDVQRERGTEGLTLLHELDQIMEITGCPAFIDNVDLVAAVAKRILRVTHNPTSRWFIWLLRNLHSHSENIFIRYFGRVSIAQLSPDVSQRIIDLLKGNIRFWREKCRYNVEEERRNERLNAINRLRISIVALSRMTVRMNSIEAVTAFQLAAEIAHDHTNLHPWITEAAFELAKYALQAVPKESSNEVILPLFKLPLAKKGDYPRIPWIEVIPSTWTKAIQREPSLPAWRDLIPELLLAAGAESSSRSDAVDRLAVLAEASALTTDELNAFADILWAKLDDQNQGLPSDTILLASEFRRLPCPHSIDLKARLTCRIFDRDIAEAMQFPEHLDTALIAEKQNHLRSIVGAGLYLLPLRAERATELFDQIITWESDATAGNHTFDRDSRRSFYENVRELAGEILSVTVAPSMTAEAKDSARLRSLFDFIERSKSWRGVPALLHFLETAPDMQTRIELFIKRGLSASDYQRIRGSTNALIRWAHMISTKELTYPLPKSLIEQLIFMIETRQEEGLHILLHTVTTLLQRNSISDIETMRRLAAALAELLDDTSYSNIFLDSRRAVSISLVRQECVRLSSMLRKQGVIEDEALERWLSEAQLDPLPEVRFALEWSHIQDGEALESY